MKAARPGSEGGPAQQCAGPTRQEEVRGDARAETRFHFRTGTTSLLTRLVVSEAVGLKLEDDCGQMARVVTEQQRVGDLPAMPDQNFKPEVGSCSVGSNLARDPGETAAGLSRREARGRSAPCWRSPAW